MNINDFSGLTKYSTTVVERASSSWKILVGFEAEAME